MTYTMTADEAVIYSDMYKDANSFRPRHVCNDFFDRASFELEMQYLQLQFEESMMQESAWDASAYDRWISGVHKTARETGNSVATVVRWFFEAEGLRLSVKDDRGQYSFNNGFFSLRHLLDKIR